MNVIKQICLLWVFLVFSVSAKAESLYLHLGAGQSMLASEYLTSKNPETYLGLIGYRLSQRWAVEASRFDLVKMENTTVGAEVKTKATSINAVRVFDFREPNGPLLSVLVKVGYARVKTTAKGIPAQFVVPSEITKNGLTYGVGMRAAIDENWTLRVDVDSLDTGVTGLGRSTTITGGVGYDF